MSDPVKAPSGYTWHPVSECRYIVQEFDYNIATAMAYMWRYKYKNGVEDLRKAQEHIGFEIERLESKTKPGAEE